MAASTIFDRLFSERGRGGKFRYRGGVTTLLPIPPMVDLKSKRLYPKAIRYFNRILAIHTLQ